MRGIRRLAVFLMAVVLPISAGGVWTPEEDLAFLTAQTGAYIWKSLPEPGIGSVGGEWAILGLARSGVEVPEGYFQDYYARVEDYVAEKQGVLHEVKYTEYSRLTVALSALGKDARNVAGYDLTKPLGDFDQTVWQGINGPAWALLALDSASYPMPKDPAAETQATRQMYVEYLLDRRESGGGWSLTGAGDADPDVTGMVLQALAKYTDQPEVARAVEEALECMSLAQKEDGGFESWGGDASESTVQMLVALCELGIPLEDERFVKEGNTLLDALLSYRLENGGFSHGAGESGVNQMSTEQGLYGLAALLRVRTGQPSLYRMTDALDLPDREETRPAQGLPGKDLEVCPPRVSLPEADFPDLEGSSQALAVRELARRGILNGYDDGRFHGEDGLTRAQFATMVVKALGLPGGASEVFVDVAPTSWYAAFVGAAYRKGIVAGTGEDTFTPDGPITRQEAAVMVTRAAGLCGMDTELDAVAVRDILAGEFVDYVSAADWARPALAFCCEEGILDTADMELKPLEEVSRAEVAGMLYRLLEKSRLL